MLVKNTLTGNKIEKKDAYIIKINNKNCFFSNEGQYKDYMLNKKLEQTIFDSYIDLLKDKIPFETSKDLYVIAKRHLNGFKKLYDIKYINYMFNHIDLDNIGDNIDFISPKAKYMYFYKVVSNKLSLNYESYLDVKIKKAQDGQNVLKNGLHFELSKRNIKSKKEDISKFL